MLQKFVLKEKKQEKQKSKTVFETHFFLFVCLKDEIHARQSQKQN